jgi:FkbM family methyltransferase
MTARHRILVQRALRRLGLERIRHPSFVDLMRHERIETVLDVGANEGQFGADLRARGYRGRIVSFEPIPEVHARLARRARRDARWDTHRLGLGEAAGEMPMLVAKASVCSSFREPTAYFSGRFSGALAARHEVVPVERLDRFLAAHPLDPDRTYLKIDTQGFEKQVLLGAGARLRELRVVQLEIATCALYEGQETLLPMLAWMTAQGFTIAMAKEAGFDWRATRLNELDIAFVRS